MRYIIGFIVFAVVINFLASLSVHPMLDPSIQNISNGLSTLNPVLIFQSIITLIQSSITVISNAITPANLVPVMFFFALFHG